MTTKLNILIAYPYCNEPVVDLLKKFPKNDLRFVLDSGAFTAWKSGNPIELDDYCTFLEKLPIKPWRYFTLDVIGDPDKTAVNFEKMLQRGFNPIPIYQPGEDIKAFDYFYSKSDVVAIGGINGFRGKKRKGYIHGAMKVANGRKVHLLGFTNMDYIKLYKPYMCDSSTWENGARYGYLMMYMGRGQFEKIQKQLFKTKVNNKKILSRIKYFGIDPYLMAKTESWHGGVSRIRTLSARSGVALSVDVEEYLNTKLFLALITDMAFELLSKSFNYLYRGGEP